MRYGQIREYDVANGIGIRVTIFVTGCTHNCYNCFNKEYQDFNFGKKWTNKETKQVIKYLQKPEVEGLTILGGEPMQNTKDLIPIVRTIKKEVNKPIWVYSGDTLEEILENNLKTELLKECDVLVDGLFVEELKDLRLKFRGSSNQRIIDIKKTLEKGQVELLKI